MRLIWVLTMGLLVITSCQEITDTHIDSIYFGGTIIPMTEPNQTFDALAIKDGKIYQTGSLKEIMALKEGQTQLIDLKGKTLLPGFIDSHSHIMMGAQTISMANLSAPPVSDVKNISDILRKLIELKENNELAPGQWIMGWGYDPDLLEEGRHPNKFDLDQAFPDNPVMLTHVSGHLAVVNSKGLEEIGMTAETPDPQGGQIMRVVGSKEPNGVLAETAVFLLREKLPKPTESESIKDLLKTFELYASNGITTINDGFSQSSIIHMLQKLSDTIEFPLDVISLVGFTDMVEFLEDPNFVFKKYDKRLKFAGVKIVTDGSPQGKTARMSKPYLTEVPGCAHDCKGISTVTQAQLDGLLDKLYGLGIQVYSHCNGDGAIEMFLNAHDAAIKKHGLSSPDLRSVIIHSQFMRPDLIDQYAEYGLIPSYFTNHTFFWGDVHMQNMGQERAFFTSPLQSSLDAGITFTNHSDYPITPLDPIFMIWSATNRISRSNQVIGPDERIETYEALKALTINAAFQYFEDDIKGTLEVGKLADMVILSDNPLKVKPEELKTITVEETIKEGKSIYRVVD
jgi:predicted amidohydrolase YtcJ